MSKELSIDRELYAKEKLDKLGGTSKYEGIGNAVHNEYVKTENASVTERALQFSNCRRSTEFYQLLLLLY